MAKADEVLSAFYADADQDGFGAGQPTYAATEPAGYVADNTDCDDASAAVHPGATETFNHVDDNCDGTTDEGFSRAGAPAIGKASSGPRGGRITATARWTAPRNDGGSALTRYRVRALKLNSNGAVVRRATRSAGPSATSLVMRVTAGRYKFRVRAVNAVGRSPWSTYSNRVTAR